MIPMINQLQAQKQQMKISPLQIHLLDLYALNTLELEQRFKKELEDNPFLEANEETTEDVADKKADEVQDYQDWDEFAHDDNTEVDRLAFQTYLNSEVLPSKPLACFVDFREEARQQLRMLELSDEQTDIALFLIDMLNEKGMLDRSIDDITEDYSFKKQCVVDPDAIYDALSIVQSLEPEGLGVSSIQECLLVQLRNRDYNCPTVRMASMLIERYYHELTSRQFEKIYHALHINAEQFREVLAYISHLKFYPVRETQASYEPRYTIIPDLVVSKIGNDLHVALHKSKKDSFYINHTLYEESARACGKKDRLSQQYIKDKIQSAQWFINAVKQREENMLHIMKCIVKLQHDYFMEGDVMQLRPMVLRNIADLTGLDLATISRITGNKHVDTHFGPISLKSLFSEGISDQKGKVISNKVIQSVIEEMITKEDKCKPYTDQQLMNVLVSQGYKIARRTVTKYREHLKIPVAQVRAVVF